MWLDAANCADYLFIYLFIYIYIYIYIYIIFPSRKVENIGKFILHSNIFSRYQIYKNCTSHRNYYKTMAQRNHEIRYIRYIKRRN